jgi:hypothetical protein
MQFRRSRLTEMLRNTTNMSKNDAQTLKIHCRFIAHRCNKAGMTKTERGAKQRGGIIPYGGTEAANYAPIEGRAPIHHGRGEPIAHPTIVQYAGIETSG